MIFRCKICGGTIEFEPGATIGICDSCGIKQTLPKLDDEKRTDLYDRANHLRRNNEFDKAAGIYESVLNDDPTDAEAYWNLVLCKYGIEYVEDPTTHKRIPTVNRAQYTSIFDDADYRSALKYADTQQRSLYESEAVVINEIQKGILAISQKEEPFDIFICYKETDAHGRRTPDSVLATELYHQLVKEGFRVFFSRITLEDKLGTAYEPYIFAALNSAKVMVVLGTKPEYFNAVWVKNEWSRYLALVKQSSGKKVLIPAYRDMDPYDLPEEFSHLQAQDMSKLGFMQDLIRGTKKILDFNGSDTRGKSVPISKSFDIDISIKKVFLLIEDRKDAEAKDLLERILDADPQNVQAFIGKLLLEAGVTIIDELIDSEYLIYDSKNLERAIRFADQEFKQKLIDIRFENAYRVGQKQLARASTDTDFEIAESIFERISGYKDTAILIEQCRSERKTAREEKTYTEALALMGSATTVSNTSIEKLNKAISLYKTVVTYKDSEDKIDDCSRRIEELRVNIKAKRKKRTIVATIAGIAVAMSFAIGLSLKFIIIPSNHYNNALSLMESGDYDSAMEAFELLGAYKDAEVKITECRNKKGEVLFSEKKYKEAADCFNGISEYENAKERYNESIYQLALQYYHSGEYDKSDPLFKSLKDYKDSAKKIHNHDWQETETKDATCTEKGFITYKCAICDQIKTEELAALGHEWEDATCTDPKTCSRCGETSGSALGHTDGAKCERCGLVLFKTLKYTGSGGYQITGINLPKGQYLLKCDVEYGFPYCEYDLCLKTNNASLVELSGIAYGANNDGSIPYDELELFINDGSLNPDELRNSCQKSFSGGVSDAVLEFHGPGPEMQWTITIEAIS